MATTGAKTNMFEALLLNHLFRNGTAPVTGLYIGLVTGTPTVTDTAADLWYSTHEVAADKGYSRQALTNGNMSAALLDGTISNSAEINFGTSTGVSAGAAAWGTVTGFIITTGSTIAETGTYYYGIFDTEKSVATGDSVRITASNLTITEQ